MNSSKTYNFPCPNPENEQKNWPWIGDANEFPLAMPDGCPWPKISVVTPSYNQGIFLEETIRSVLLQGYPRLEYLIIDGGSIDNTLNIIDRYEPWLTYWVSEQDRGQSHAVNKGIQKASGDILLWLNSDDICLPDALQKVALAFHNNPLTTIVTGQARVINVKGEIIGELRSQFTSWEELVTNPCNSIRQISTFFSRRLFYELGMVDESLEIAMDSELLVRFTQFHVPIVIDEYLTAYRTHPETKTQHQLIKGYEESERMRKRYLLNHRMVSTYRRRSSKNWHSLSEYKKFTPLERMKCLMHSIQNQPGSVFYRRFLSSFKVILVDFVYSSKIRSD